MRPLFIFLLWGIFTGTFHLFSASAQDLLPLPNPHAVFEKSITAKIKPELETIFLPDSDGRFQEMPSYVAGHKEVSVGKINGSYHINEKQCVTISIDGKQVGMIHWWGAFEGGKEDSFGYPFKNIENDPATLTINHKNQTTIFRKPYIDSNGKRAVFTYGMRPLPKGQIEIAWKTGSKETVSPWFVVENTFYRECKCVFGNAVFQPHSEEELSDHQSKLTEVSGNFIYNANDPLNGYTVLFQGLRGFVDERMHAPEADGRKRFEFCYRTENPNPDMTQGSIIIDLGEVAFQDKTLHPVVRGVNFWRSDATDVPISPTRNIMPNPSFEQGLRYWRWHNHGESYVPSAKPRYEVILGGVFGKHTLAIHEETKGAGIQTFPISLEGDKDYTLSFYAKSMDEDTKSIEVSIGNAATFGGTYARNSPHPNLYGDVDEPESKFNITKEWKRYSRTFRGDPAGVIIRLFSSNYMIDAFQLEEGKHPTEFVAPHVEGLLVTSKPDSDIFIGEELDARFLIFGKPNSPLKIRTTLFNAFREDVYQESFDVSLDEAGEKLIHLPLQTESLGQGIFLLKAEYEVSGFPRFHDYYRFSIMAPLENNHATKNIFGILFDHTSHVSRGDDMARKLMEWGWGSTTWTSFEAMRNESYVKRMRKYRFTNMHTPVIEDIALKIYPLSGDDPNPHDAQEKIYALESVSEEFVKKVEEETYRAVNGIPKDLLPSTAFGNEEEGYSFPKVNEGDDYFKLQLAVAKGAKRANPDILIAPTCGTSGYSLVRAFDDYERYLATAARHGFKYDVITVHPYGNIDKGIFSECDLDEETARLIEQMKRYGYGKETPIYYTESFNMPFFHLREWDNQVISGDLMVCGKPTYDFGRYEFIQAASASRLYIICLKYWPQLQCANIWETQPFLDTNFSPLLLCKAVNTLGNELRNVKFHSDIRLNSAIRGYVFTLEDGTGIASLWVADKDIEDGIKENPTIRVRFEQPVEFIDFMGCKRTSFPEESGAVIIPVTPAPLLIKAQNVARLSNAFQKASHNSQ